ELVDQQQSLPPWRFSDRGVMQKIFDEVAGEAGGVVPEGDAVEEEVAGGGVFVGPGSGEAVCDGGGEGAVAGQCPFAHRRVDVRVRAGKAFEELEQGAGGPVGCVGG